MPRYVEPTEQLVVEVFVRDMQRSKAFYLELGFELVEDRGEFVDLAWEGHHLYLDFTILDPDGVGLRFASRL
jgi:catechol 2,3-dioxygenase-like lactoylglutathione lyase family enzyme